MIITVHLLTHAYIKPLKDIEDILVADGMGVVSKAIVVEVNMKEHPCDYRGLGPGL